MRVLCNLLVILVCSLTLLACGGDSNDSSGGNPTSPSTPSASCVTSISPVSVSFPATGGTGSITLTAPSNCTWSARANVNWITGTATYSSGSGNAVLLYTVEPNSTASSRTGTITVAGLTVTVTQSGSPFLEVKGNYTFRLLVASSCNWPVRDFSWPITVQVNSYLNGVTDGILVFPSNRWGFQAEPGKFTRLQSGGGPGLNGNYEVDDFGEGRPTASYPTRASDGRGEILDGVYYGYGSLHLTYKVGWQYESWVCRDATWTMRIR